MCEAHSPPATQASHSANVTANLDTANGLAMVTLCRGSSDGWWPASFAVDPIANEPAGIATISGQSVAQSLKESSRVSARSSALAGAAVQNTDATKSKSVRAR